MKKSYKNVGPTEILGHSPGVTFTTEIPEWQEKVLVEGGGLELVGDSVEPVVTESDAPEITDEVGTDDNVSVELNKSPESPATPPPLGNGKGK